jgi:hypothetical protein
MEQNSAIKGRIPRHGPTECADSQELPDGVQVRLIRDTERLLLLNRGHWSIENGLHWVRDVTFDEDRSQIRTSKAPRVMASLRNLVVNVLRICGATNISEAIRSFDYKTRGALELIGL